MPNPKAGTVTPNIPQVRSDCYVSMRVSFFQSSLLILVDLCSLFMPI